MTTYTISLRLDQPTVGASTTWATELNTDLGLIDTAIAGRSTVNINGLTTYSLTSNNGAADEARQPVYIFTGALSANCTVTIPAVVKFGFCVNNTTGGHSVILSCGGVTLTVSRSGYWTFFQCDGTDVTSPNFQTGGFATAGLLCTTILSAGLATFAVGAAVVSGLTTDTLSVTSTTALADTLTATNASLSGTFETFVVSAATVGSIVGNGVGGVAYNTTSDYRLKITYGRLNEDAGSGSGWMIDNVPVYSGAFKSAPTLRRPMFLAHELQKEAYWAVTGEKDGMRADGTILAQVVDHSALVPVLWAELQALRRRVATLERGYTSGLGRGNSG